MTEPPAYPNLLFIMTDQQRFDALSCHGGWIQTPNLDRLAGAGIDLRGHYAQAPVCVPSRCSLFSGRYGHAHGVLENDRRLGSHEVHMFKVLRQHGYHLAYAGKNHLLCEAEMVANFDRYSSIRPSAPKDPRRAAYVALEEKSLQALVERNSWSTGEYHDFPDEVTSSGMVAAVTKQNLSDAPSDRSWCVVSSFSDPHVPHLAPRRFCHLYPEDSIPLPEWNEAELASKHPRVAVKRGVQRAADANPSDQRRYLAVYGAMCTYVDELIGGLLSTLRARTDADRTLIIFVSDHGDFGWHQGLCKKDLLLYDDLIHVPAFLHWPNHLKSRVVDETLSENVDLMPTILELAGLPIPDACQGRSMAGLCRGVTSQHRSEIHAEVCYPHMRSGYRSVQDFQEAWNLDQKTDGPLSKSAPYNVPGDHTRCVRTDRWKYIWYGDGFEELYDLRNDPDERRNIMAESSSSVALAQLRQRLAEWARATTDRRTESERDRVFEQYDRWNHCIADSR